MARHRFVRCCSKRPSIREQSYLESQCWLACKRGGVHIRTLIAELNCILRRIGVAYSSNIRGTRLRGAGGGREGRPDRFAALAVELTQLKVDVIVTYNNAGVAALQRATRTIPIVFASVGDPVGSGFVASLARPGGNITGFTGLTEELSRKWVEL